MDLSHFEAVQLLPGAREYRDFIDDATHNRGWGVAAAVTTLFLEGTAYERHELDPSSPPRPTPALTQHPLVKHYGLPLESLALTKAHRAVEGEHRAAAWRVMLDHIPEESRPGVVAAMKEAVRAWQTYRDDVAEACGITRDLMSLTA